MISFKSLRNKFLAIYFGIIFCSFLILASILPSLIRSYFVNQNEKILKEEAKVISKQYIGLYKQNIINKIITIEQMKDQLRLIDEALNAKLWILDTEGRFIYDSNDIPTDEMLDDKMFKLFNEVRRGNVIKVEGVFNKYFRQPVLTVGMPIIVQYGELKTVVGVIFIHAMMEDINSTVNDMYNIIIICLIISLMVALLLIFILTKKIILPLNQMNKAVKSIANGDFSKRVNIYSDDEVGQLANSFNEMAEELNKLEVLRKNFIANISHDFRSPLTSIKGFVQAILDGTIPKDSEDKYLNIVLNETSRLTRLTNNILDLTKMESDEMELEITDFDVNEVIRKILIGLEQRITDKNLNIDLNFVKEKLNVRADIEKIQRVLYNLIDNAIKFCCNGDKISIETTIISKKAYITIADTGSGIEKESLKYIWDRFHKGDKSRGKDKVGTGLGLSIVKQIIIHHGEDIDVESSVGEGTKFTFTLPLATSNHLLKSHKN